MLKGWQKIALLALIVVGFWWLFVKKSGYSLCNLAEYASDTVTAMVPPGMVVESVADMSVPSATVASASIGAVGAGMGMGASTYARRGCGCNK